MEIKRIVSILKKITIFGGLDDSQLEYFVPLLESQSYKKDEVIFEQGSQPSYIYIIESGKVKITGQEDGQKYDIVTFDMGDCFGEMSVVGVMPHTGSAVCSQDTKLILLSRQTLMKMYNDDPNLFSFFILNIARELSRRLFSTNQTLLQYTSLEKS